MRRYIAGLGLASLILAVGVSWSGCKKNDEDEGDDGSGNEAGATFIDAGIDRQEVVVPCEGIIGLDTANCDTSEQAAQSLEVNMLLVMDKSGSMNDTPDGYDTSKWEALRAALGAALVDVQDRIKFGLEFFPTSASSMLIPSDCGESGRCCEMPGGTDMNVAITEAGEGPVNDILSALESREPAGGTPTGTAIERARAYFEQADLSGRNYVLLATDGGPNCNEELSCNVDECTLNIDDAQGCPPEGISCCNTTPTACLDTRRTAELIADLADMGVQTIVVGIPGSEAYGAALEDFAVAGGFVRPDADTAGTSYYEVSAEGGVDELTDTFRTITTQLVMDCQVPLEYDREAVNLNEVNVAVNCELLPYSEVPPDEGF